MENSDAKTVRHEPQQPQPCAGGCGFFGSPATKNLCSVCFKKSLCKPEPATAPRGDNSAVDTTVSRPADTTHAQGLSGANTALSTPVVVTSAQSVPVLTSGATAVIDSLPKSSDTTSLEDSQSQATVESGGSSGDGDNPNVQKNRKRCWACKKKVGLVGIECRCGFVFCGSHRYPQQHSCSFDFKNAEREELRRRNPGGGHFDKIDKL